MSFSDSGLDHSEARTEEQKKLMMQIEADGVCPFCAEHFKKYHPRPIITETDFWFVTENISPYEGTTHHFLFVYKPAHINSPADMLPGAADDLYKLAGELQTEHAIKGGTVFMRFGEGGYTGSSVAHLHAHLIAGGPKTEDSEGLKVKLGYKKSD